MLYIPGGSCTTWSRSELVKKTIVQALGFAKYLHLWARCPTYEIICLPRSYGDQSSCGSDPEIRKRSAMTRSAMQSLDRHLWRSCIMNKTKFPIMLYGFECGQFTWRIYSELMPSVMQSEWCRRRILDIRWHYFVRNVDIRSDVVNYFWGERRSRKWYQMIYSSVPPNRLAKKCKVTLTVLLLKSCVEQKNAWSRFPLKLFKLTKFGNQFSGKSLFVVTRCYILKLKCTKFVFSALQTSSWI